MSAKISLYDQRSAFQERISEARASAWTIVYPSELVRLRQAARERISWQSDQISISSLWGRLAAGARPKKPLPTPLGPIEDIAVARELISDLPVISQLADSNQELEQLLRHLTLIERQADQDYQPTDQIEKSIEILRGRLAERGLATFGGRESAIARISNSIRLERPLLIAGVDDFSRQLGGLVKGLAELNQVELALTILPEFSEASLAALGFANCPELEIDYRWSNPGQQIETSANLSGVADLLDWTNQAGEPGSAGISSAGIADKNLLLASAGKYELDLFLEIRSGPTASRLGQEMIRSARSPSRLGQPWRDAFFRASAESNLSALRVLEHYAQTRLRASRASSGRAELDQAEISDLRWLLTLGRLLTSLESWPDERIQPGELLMAIFEPARPYSSPLGAIVDRPAALASADLERVALLIEPGRIRQISPFISAALGEQCPQLLDDNRPLADAAAIAGSDRALLSIVNSDNPGALVATLANKIQVESASPDPRLRAVARFDSEQLIEIAEELAAIDQKPSRDQIEEKNAYSVTELESWLSCPLGWWADRHLGSRDRLGAAAGEGSLIHALLEPENRHLLDQPESLPATVTSSSGEEIDWSEYWSPARAGLELERLRQTSDLYAFTGSESFYEFKLDGEIDLDGELIRVYGRADRIVVSEQGLLVIDYKSSLTAIASLKPEEKLQPYIYPALASQMLERPILGFSYIEARSGRHNTILNSSNQNFFSEQGQTRRDWWSECQRASESIARAAAGINQGDWFRVNRDCPSWCAHHRLSRTLSSSEVILSS